MAGTSEGSKKAAETRKQEDPNAFKNMGQKGAEARQEQHSHEELSEIAKRSAETRKQEDPDAFRKMGQKGGSHSSRSTTSDEDEE